MFQWVLTCFLESPKIPYQEILFSEEPEQLTLNLSFIASIHLDMRKLMSNVKSLALSSVRPFKTLLNNEFVKYRLFKQEFINTGSVQSCPDYVYFLVGNIK